MTRFQYKPDTKSVERKVIKICNKFKGDSQESLDIHIVSIEL